MASYLVKKQPASPLKHSIEIADYNVRNRIIHPHCSKQEQGGKRLKSTLIKSLGLEASTNKAT